MTSHHTQCHEALLSVAVAIIRPLNGKNVLEYASRRFKADAMTKGPS